MQQRVGTAADPRRFETDRMSKGKRLGVDDLQRILQRPADRKVDRQPFERSIELGYFQ